MKKFEGILICTDLDGTLLRDDKSISRENLEAIEYFKSEGGRFTFVSGRMPYFASSVYDAIKPNAPMGCINGGGIYDFEAGEYVCAEVLPREALDLVEYAEKNIPGLGISIYTFERIYFSAENSAMEEFRAATKVANAVKPYREIDIPIAKIVFGDKNRESIKKLAEILPTHPLAENFNFVSSELTLYEILPKGVNKGSILPKLAAHLGIDRNKTIAVGDYNNDVPMLRAAAVGVAVANACPEAKEAADYVTVSNEEHAIAQIIADLDSGILKL
ncbi:MAG: HAD family phosphatase [Clostridia bacterium]|nr:HAD family phosphatase [Clostridia bacterium]